MKQQKPLNPIVPRLHLACLALFGLLPGVLLAQQSNPNVVFSVAPNNQTLYYPSTMQYLPDEHTTIMPVPRLRGEPNARQPAAPDYLFFVAANNSNYGGTFVLKTTDLIHFDFAQNYGSAAVHGNAVMWPPNEFTDCQYTGATVFDQNYAAPGTVLQDPTRPPENFIMIYEAEQHCPAGPGGQFEFPYWASVGLARSSDGGKTWPQPGQYGADRYAAVTLAGTEPPTPHPPWGDAVPSAFIDDVRHKCDDDQEARCKQKGYFIYAVYYFNGSPSLNPDGYMRIARAKLGGDGSRQFKKWYVDPKTKIGGWTEDGIGGLDSGFTPALGCTEPAYQINGQISYIDALRVYLLTYVCARLQRQSDGTY